MPDAIVGYTGFVGSNLVRQTHFDDFYNSKNIENIGGKTYDLLVCSCAPAEKWRVNKEPLRDLENLNRLTGCLSKVHAHKVILISTVDIYPTPIGVDEGTTIDPDLCHPYGKHRLELERFVADHFDALIVRLPGLFGNRLKKNIIYDFLHNNSDYLKQVHADSIFQFYHLDNLWRDIQISLSHHLELVNFATEPTSVYEIARDGFGFEFNNRPQTNPVNYNFRSRYAHLFGGSDGYLYDKQQVLLALKGFIKSWQGNK